MQIATDTVKVTRFSEIAPGGVFLYEGQYFIKVEKENEYTVDAVELVDGVPIDFCPGDEVISLKAKLVIE